MNEVNRRSLLHARLVQAGAQFGVERGGEVVLSFGEAKAEAEAARHLALADLSALPRAGVKGSGAAAWLKETHHLTMPPAPNRAVLQADGSFLLALSAEEHLLLPPLQSANDNNRLCEKLAAVTAEDAPANCTLLPRTDSHCHLALCGTHTAEMLAKLCGVDMREPHFAPGSVAQTSLARVNAILTRTPCEKAPLFHLLADSASIEYLWDCILDAMTEFNGTPIGITALRQLAATA